MTALAAILGFVVGAALAAVALNARRTARVEAERARRHELEIELAERRVELEAAQTMLERLRAEHDETVRNLGPVFSELSTEVLARTVDQFNQTQAHVARERHEALDRTLKPLSDLLDEYKRNLTEFDRQHVGALADVKNRAEELLVEQRRMHDETKRLNQLLGRGDQRGRWGELQLQNILRASGLREQVDYDLQVTARTEGESTVRPDCVVNLPGGSHLAIDAKFPFDRFEAGLAASDADERTRLFAEHARALVKHVRDLGSKSYWSAVSPAPEFVVCFVPSDAALTAALDAGVDLFVEASRARVVVAGPATLLSLLWTVAFVNQRHMFHSNAEEIYERAKELADRIRLVAEPVAKMGRAIETTVSEYNRLIGSFESRLLVTVRRLNDLGGVSAQREMPELKRVERLTSRLDEGRWGEADDDAARLTEHPVIDGEVAGGEAQDAN